MTPELIKQWMRQAGFERWIAGYGPSNEEWLSAFAALVAAHQRELDGRICDEMAEDHLPNYTEYDAGLHQACNDCAAAIRGAK